MDTVDETQQPEEKKVQPPPYVAFKTFRNFVDSLKVAMPSRIDRSVMHTMSGAAQSQIMVALRSMGLVSGHGIPTEAFKILVQSEGEERKGAMLASIKMGFPFLFDDSINLETATGKQLLEKFSHTSLNGNTVRRAVAFFLMAAKEAGLNLSPYFKNIQARSGAPPVKRPAANGAAITIPELTGAAADQDEVEENFAEQPERTFPSPPAESLTVELESGGTLTLTATTSFIKMSPEDRTFVFDIIDRLQKYGVTPA